MNNKAIIEFGYLGGCYPFRSSPSVNNTLLDQRNSSYPTQPHSIIAKCNLVCGCWNISATRGLEALTRMLFSGHRLVCVRRVRPGNEINENGEWFFCKGKRKP